MQLQAFAELLLPQPSATGNSRSSMNHWDQGKVLVLAICQLLTAICQLLTQRSSPVATIHWRAISWKPCAA